MFRKEKKTNNISIPPDLVKSLACVFGNETLCLSLAFRCVGWDERMTQIGLRIIFKGQKDVRVERAEPGRNRSLIVKKKKRKKITGGLGCVGWTAKSGLCGTVIRTAEKESQVDLFGRFLSISSGRPRLVRIETGRQRTVRISSDHDGELTQ